MMKTSYYWKSRFPTLAIILLVAGVLWLLNDLGILNIDIPWWPIILIIVAIGWIFNHYLQGHYEE